MMRMFLMKEEEDGGLDLSGPRGGEEKYTFRWQLPELGDWLHPQGKCGGVSETILGFWQEHLLLPHISPIGVSISPPSSSKK